MPACCDHDRFSRTEETPVRVVWTTPDVGESAVTNTERLCRPVPAQAALSNPDCCKVLHYGATPGLLLDFGRELHGGVKIVVGGVRNGPLRFRLRLGESVAEAMSELGGETNATNDHAMRDMEILVPGLGSIEVGNSGFRFVRLDLIGDNQEGELVAVRAISVMREIPEEGAFTCSDARLNRIWQTGARTVHLCMQDYLWDGIKRDRLVWIGDMHPETMTILSVFGANVVVPKSLDFIRDLTPASDWMNGISSYSLWWLRIHAAWFRHSGDLAYLSEQRTYLGELLRSVCACADEEGCEKLTGWRFLDWPTNGDEPAVHAGLQGLLRLTLLESISMCRALGDEESAARCETVAARLLRHIPPFGESKQAAALLALGGLSDAKAMARVLLADGAKRLSTFYGYYVLQALAQAGEYARALSLMREFWGAMLDLGATSFWEDFNLDWLPAARIDEPVPAGMRDIHGDFGAYCYKGFRHSLCHGWASGPTAWLSEHVLGVSISEPGCRTVRIAPNLADLAWAEGRFPTPYGPIRILHERKADGSVVSDIAAPAGIRIEG